MPYDRLSQLRPRITIGTKQTLRAMKSNSVSEVLIATDADQIITKQVVELAEQLNIPCTQTDSKEKLGAACGVEVGTSAVGIKLE